jgi:hypothetical protein
MLGTAAGDPRDAASSCIVLHDPHCGVGAAQTVQTNSSAQLSFAPPCEQAFYWALPVRPCTRATVIGSPDLFALYASRFPHWFAALLYCEAFPDIHIEKSD